MIIFCMDKHFTLKKKIGETRFNHNISSHAPHGHISSLWCGEEGFSLLVSFFLLVVGTMCKAKNKIYVLNKEQYQRENYC